MVDVVGKIRDKNLRNRKNVYSLRSLKLIYKEKFKTEEIERLMLLLNTTTKFSKVEVID